MISKRVFSLLCAFILCLTLLPRFSAAQGERPLHVIDDIYRDGEYQYRVLEDGTAEIVCYMGESHLEIREIASSLGGHPVSAIGERAFSNEGWIEFYTDEYPFYHRESIRRLTVPEGITRIGAYAFEYDFNLIEISLPSTLLEIGEGAFDQCTTLTRVFLPAGLRTLGSFAFRDCIALTRMALPESLDEIGDNPFAGCTHLTEITVPDAHPFLRFENGMLCDQRQKKLIAATKYADPQALTDLSEIGACAFASMPLTSLAVPASVTAVGNFAFMNCKSLSSLALPESLETLGDNPVLGCTALTDLTLGEGRFAVRDEALIDEREGRLIACLIPAPERRFNPYPQSQEPVEPVLNAYGASVHLVERQDYETWFDEPDEESIRKVYTVPEGVVCIGAGAFHGIAVRKIVLPDSVTSLGCGAFCRCEYLESCRIPEAVTAFPDHLFDQCKALTDVNLPAGLTRIGDYALAETQLPSLILPDTVTQIGRYAFKNVSRGGEAEVRLSPSLHEIPKGAFYGCGVLSLSIPDTVVRIGQEAFARTYSLESIRLPKRLNAILDFCFFDSSIQRIDWPWGLEYIGDYAFHADSYHSGSMLGTVTIPDTVKYLGRSAFYNQRELTEASLPGGITLGESVFCACSNLKTVTLADDITAIPGKAFSHTNLETIRIPDTVSFIGERAFASTPLASIAFPACTLHFGGNPFTGTAIRNVFIPPFHPNLQLQGNYLIDTDTRTLITGFSLTEETVCQVPDGIEAIAPYAFYNGKYESLMLPDSLRDVGDYAFSGFESLKDLHLPEGLERIGECAFSSVYRSSAYGPSVLRLPVALKYLGSNALPYAEEIFVPAGVEYIGLHALSCKQAVLESAFVTLEGNPFTSSAEKVILSPDHPSLELADGNLYDQSGQRLIAQLSGAPVREGTLEIAPLALTTDHQHKHSDKAILPASVELIALYGEEGYYGLYPHIYALPDSAAEAFFDGVQHQRYGR